MTWIMILLMTSAGAGGPATAEFMDRTACETAIARTQASVPFGVGVRGICVPKATRAGEGPSP